MLNQSAAAEKFVLLNVRAERKSGSLCLAKYKIHPGRRYSVVGALRTARARKDAVASVKCTAKLSVKQNFTAARQGVYIYIYINSLTKVPNI